MSPKSGSPGSPVSPADPATPHDADKADPVDTAEAKARQREAQTGKYGSAPVKPFKPDAGDGAGSDSAGDGSPEEQPKKKTWIEIKLVDVEGEPIPGEPYEVKLPDGRTVASGTLDEKGWARVEGFDPGSCKVSFPRMDKRAWKRK